jgi:hypothetical protein
MQMADGNGQMADGQGGWQIAMGKGESQVASSGAAGVATGFSPALLSCGSDTASLIERALNPGSRIRTRSQSKRAGLLPALRCAAGLKAARYSARRLRFRDSVRFIRFVCADA